MLRLQLSPSETDYTDYNINITKTQAVFDQQFTKAFSKSGHRVVPRAEALWRPFILESQIEQTLLASRDNQTLILLLCSILADFCCRGTWDKNVMD